jgi:hypothetical protein
MIEAITGMKKRARKGALPAFMFFISNSVAIIGKKLGTVNYQLNLA